MDGLAELVKLIGNYGMGAVCLAVLILLHWYNVRVTLPNLAKESRDQTNGLVKDFREELQKERDQCHEDHERMMLSQTEMMKALTVLVERNHHRQ